MGENWNPEDFKHDQERSSNAGDSTVVLLRHLTSSLSASSPVFTRPANILGEPLNGYVSSFGETFVSERTLEFEVRSLIGLSAIRDVTGSINNGSITHSGSEFRVETAALTSSMAYLETARHGQYVAGIEMLAVVAVRIPQEPEGAQDFCWGYFDDSDGYFFGKTVTGSYVAVKKSGSVTHQVYQTDWNLDKLDGTGPSRYNLSQFSDSGHIYTTRFLWHGYGFIEWIVSTFGANNQQIDVPVHRERVTGSVSINNPHLPVRIQIFNNSTAQSASVYTTCRSVSINGRHTSIYRNTSERAINKSISTTLIPIISFKRADGPSQDLADVKLQKIDILTDANIIWEVRNNSILSGSSFGTPSTTTAPETSLVSDVSAVTVASGTVLVDGIAEGGAGSKANTIAINLPHFDMILNQPLTLCAKTITGGATATFIFTVQEEW